MAAAKRITERIDGAFTEARVDREKHTIEGVLLCGTQSANGRTYPPEVLRRDHSRYEGRPVNADHSRESTVDRRIGWFSDVRPGRDGRPRGTFNVLKSHPMYERVMEAAERNPGLFGFSHVAMCETKIGTDGAEIIERIQAVESIDLVADPATTKGLFESREQPKMITVKALAESVLRNPKSTTEQILKIKRLAEDDGGVSMAEPASDDPKEAISAGFKAAILAVVESAMGGGDPKEALAKIKKLLNAHNDATTEPEPKAAGGDVGGAVGAEESKKRPAAVDPLSVLEECRKQGLNPSGAEIKALCLMEAVDRAAWMTDQRAKMPAEEPKSRGRQPGTGGATRKTESTAKPVEITDLKSFLGAITAA